MRGSVYLLAVGGGALVQSTVVPLAAVGGVVVDLPVILAVFLALRRGPEVGCLAGFGLGLARDVLAGGPLGLQALSKGAVGFAAGVLPRWWLVSNPLVPVASVVLATVVDALIRFGLLQAFAYRPQLVEVMGAAVAPQVIYNGLVATALIALPVVRRPRGRR